MYRCGAALAVASVCLVLASCAPRATKTPTPAHQTSAALVPLRPTALAVGPNGGLFIADEMRDQILERLPGGNFRVVAGTGKVGYSGDGGPAVDAEIDLPGGMAFGPDGTLYFADQENGRVRAISPGGTITTVVGDGSPSDSKGFVSNGTPALDASVTPYDVAFAPTGRLYIATGEQVLRLDPDGTLGVVVGADIPYSGVYGTGGPAVDASADGVNGIAFDARGDLYLFGSYDKALLVVRPSGLLTEPGGDQIYARGNGGLVTAPDGSVIAMDELSVVRLSLVGDQTIASFYPGTFHGIMGFSPNGIAVGSNGTIYVDTFYGNGFADRSAIASISPDGTTSQVLWESTDEPVATLLGNGVDAALFGDSQSKATAVFDELLGKANATATLKNPGNCQIDATTRWGEVTAFFSHDQFVGYRAVGSTTVYPPGGGFSLGGIGRTAQTQLGLRVGDTLAEAQRLYGQALATSAAQGGTWTVTTSSGVLRGYLSGVPGQDTAYRLLIASIGAGDVGCPAMSP